MNARNEILDRIRAAIVNAPAAEPVPRNYDRTDACGPGDVELFAHTLGEYRAQVFATDDINITKVVTGLIAPGARALLAPGLPEAWYPDRDVLVDGEPAPLTVAELDSVDVVVTGCRLGIAATGTIVLDAGPGQGKRALTLIPDHHICIVRADQIVDTVPQAFAALDPARPLTFISGPSATSDIELDRVEGVHGPRTLDVILLR